MAHPYILGASPGYQIQSSWPYSGPYSAAMARGPSHGSGSSEYTDYSASTSGSGNGEYGMEFSPCSDTMGSYPYFSTADTSSYTTGGQGYNTYNQGDDSGFQYQYYDFILGEGAGQGSYWQLKAGYTPSATLPERMAYDQNADVPRSANDASGQHVCLEPFCNSNPFRRKADLQRHYMHIHRDVSQKKAFHCDWKKCQRFKEPFFRLDHCRDHYRDYHNEDILRRGANNESNEWWQSRNVDRKWWRCPKCLSRIYVKSDGFDCAKCKTKCESDRRKLRGYN
ncbi:hypothetical protein F5B20DRAFT_575778 [Whalleya microplaca]|nr:hypothetical protein F5B20DRAFT_575778 [Whalleya microplaca]